MAVQETLAFAQTKTGIRCMGETEWAEGETREEAERNWRAMQSRKQYLATQNTLLNQLLSRLPQPEVA